MQKNLLLYTWLLSILISLILLPCVSAAFKSCQTHCASGDAWDRNYLWCEQNCRNNPTVVSTIETNPSNSNSDNSSQATYQNINWVKVFWIVAGIIVIIYYGKKIFFGRRRFTPQKYHPSDWNN